ncbi:MAG: C40 family peptidase [Spirochaetales bacterium]|nr:C40 family peptidase [Spirochaetales bacterium]
MNIKKLIVCLCVSGYALFCVHATDVTVENYGAKRYQSAVVAWAGKMIGIPYVEGGLTDKGLDCSGLVFRVYMKALGISLPRIVTDLADYGRNSGKVLLPGDLLFFDTEDKGSPTHVAIYVGKNRFIHAASAGKKRGVIVSSLTEKYYYTRYLGAKRIIKEGWPKINITLDKSSKKMKVAKVLSPGTPIYFSLNTKGKKPEYFFFVVFKNNKQIISRTLKVYNRKSDSVVWFTPEKASYKVEIRDSKNKKRLTLEL